MDPDAVGMVSGVGQGMGVLDGVVIVEGKGSFGVNLGHPIITNGYFVDHHHHHLFAQTEQYKLQM